MTDLIENGAWVNGIYQIETTDPVLGGPPNLDAGQGISNVQAQQLANRTAYLKALLEAADPLTQYFNQTRGDARYYTRTLVDQKINDVGLANTSAAELAAAMGTIIMNTKSAMPGFARFDGATITDGATTYATTAAAFPEYVSGNDIVLDDWRGRGLRMFDETGLVDPDGASRALGDFQEDAFQGHEHQLYNNSFDPSAGGNNSAPTAQSSPNQHSKGIVSGGYGTPRVSTETRMKNVAVNFWLPLVE